MAKIEDYPLDISLTGDEKLLSSDSDNSTKNITIDQIKTYINIGVGAGDALVANPLSQFASTTSAQLAGVISNETGSGALVFATSPTLVTPSLGTPSTLVATNITGTASSLTSGNVTTNANLTGHVTSTGNAAVLGSFTVAQLSTALSDATLSGNNTGDQAITPEGTAVLSTGEVGATKFLREDGDGTSSWQTIVGGGDALVANPLSQFAATTSAQLAGVISNETGSSLLVFNTSPTLVTPALGTPSALVATNATGTASGLTAGNVTTNANLTGHITSTGNAAILGSFTLAQLNTAISDASVVTLTGSETITNKSIDADNNTITNLGGAEFDTDTQSMFTIMNALVLDHPDVTVASNGTVITLSIEKSGGGDLRYVFSDGVYTLDCTPADTVTLTAGSDISPQINYIYVLQSTKTLTASTSGFPASGEYAAVATVLTQSATSLQTDGAYKVHIWTDHASNGDNIGHLAHINSWIRQQHATWHTGTALTPTVGAATFDIATSAGVVHQLHDHDFPAFNTATGSDIYVVNDPTTNYDKLGDLTGIVQDVNGNDLTSNSFNHYNIVVWGAVNEVDADCKLYVNEPNGAYNNDSGGKASNDDDKTAVYTIPSDFNGVGFLIARLTVQYNAGTYSILQNEDLRGQFPSSSAGSGATGGNEFVDNVFRVQDDGDTSKQIAFQASGITTATTRTITMTDANVDLADVNDLPVSNLADGTDGELITWSAAGAPTTVSAGTSGQFLGSNGAGTEPTMKGLPCEVQVAISDETTALTTGLAKVTFRMPYAMTVTEVRASLTGAGSTSGTTTIDINEGGTTILSTKLTIDNTEKTSTTAAAAAVISDSSLADDAEITIDIDAVTGGANETGGKVTLIGTRA